MDKVPDHIAKLDWRINKLTWTTESFVIPGGAAVVPAESAVMQSALINYGKENVGITIPNATALFLDISEIYHTEAQFWVNKSISNKDQFGHLPEGDIFIFYQKIVASVIFACTSLEAFVNEEIADDYIHVVPEKGFTRQYTKEQIERNLSLDVKLFEILPAALKVKSPKGGKLWTSYEKLRNLRDRVIHMKTKDRDSIGEDKNSIWNALLSDPLPQTYGPAKELINYYFAATGKRPRWFEKCPF